MRTAPKSATEIGQVVRLAKVFQKFEDNSSAIVKQLTDSTKGDTPWFGIQTSTSV